MKIRKTIQEILWPLFEVDFILEHIDWDEEAKTWQTKYINEKVGHDLCVQSVIQLQQDNALLQSQIKTFEEQLHQEVNPLEDYWNNRRPKVDILYKARENRDIDVRLFINPFDSQVPVFKDFPDEVVKKAQNYVIKRVKYQRDSGEYWKFAWETYNDKYGDCEDGAILIYNICLKSGVPYWRLRLNAGWVYSNNGKEGHAYLTYLREQDNTWYVIDWCYWSSESQNFGLKWSDAENHYFDIWFSWNQKYSFNSASFENRDFEVKK